MQPMASSPPSRLTRAQAMATAPAVSRRQGSPIMLVAGISGKVLRVRGTNFAAVTMRILSLGISPLSLSIACRIRGVPPKTETNCLGKSGEESGQRRLPSPPAITIAYAFELSLRFMRKV